MRKMKGQTTMFSIPEAENTYKVKRNWENGFQKWSDKHGMDANNTESWGACGYGVMCDWCEDNSYGRPCVRALNAMCRERGLLIDYSNKDYEKVWNGSQERRHNVEVDDE